MKHALSEASLPHGFRFAATACGLKKTGALDLGLLCSDEPASAAAVFTQNLVVAAPVLISKENLRNSKGRMRGVVVNAGNANCATGTAGHAAGAIHLGKGIIERDIETKVPDKSATLVLYCGGGFRSALAADALKQMGYENAISLDGGWRAWTGAGLPVEK